VEEVAIALHCPHGQIRPDVRTVSRACQRACRQSSGIDPRRQCPPHHHQGRTRPYLHGDSADGRGGRCDLAPVLAAVGTIATMVSKFDIVVERNAPASPPRTRLRPNPTPGPRRVDITHAELACADTSRTAAANTPPAPRGRARRAPRLSEHLKYPRPQIDAERIDDELFEQVRHQVRRHRVHPDHHQREGPPAVILHLDQPTKSRQEQEAQTTAEERPTGGPDALHHGQIPVNGAAVPRQSDTPAASRRRIGIAGALARSHCRPPVPGSWCRVWEGNSGSGSLRHCR